MELLVDDLKVTRPGHVQYGDFLLGPGTPYRWRAITGWGDLPGLDSGTVPRPDAPGAYPGRLLAQARTIGLDGLMVRAPRARIGATVQALEDATVPRDDEIPLVAWLDERGPLLVHARAMRRLVPATLGYTVGLITGGAIEWEASDARRYAVDAEEVTLEPPAPESGLVWPLTWPLNFGTPGASGTATLTNRGNAPTHPVIAFRGPMVLPTLTNTARGDALEYDLPLTEDDVLVVDTGAGTVTLNGTASRIGTATARSVPEQTFTLPPGPTPLVLRTSSGAGGTCTIRYRHAYW
ncbi:phage distal tail protein [Streptomyces sp. LE64]|uniref:phage distal tail protein n=1 Tax=Streptomyces sp. LE64 TaxID=3448653 RepID=UPI0040415E94